MQDTELQQLVQRQVSQFCDRVAQALAPLEESPQREVSDTALSEALLYVSSAIDIATGPCPEVNLLDLFVFLRLCRDTLERHWIPKVYGEQGADVAAAFSKAEDDLWKAAASLFNESRKRELEELVAGWQAENPEQFRVEGVRLDDFLRQGSRDRQARGILSGVKAAIKSADQARLLAERGIFLVNRLPFLWRLQARVTAREIVSDLASRLVEVPVALGELAMRAPRKLFERVRAALPSPRSADPPSAADAASSSGPVSRPARAA
jgi:hypothetical protein